MMNEWRIQGRITWDPKLQKDDLGNTYLPLRIFWKSDNPSLDQYGQPIVGDRGFYVYREEGIDIVIVRDMLMQYVLNNCWRGQLVLCDGIISRPSILICDQLYILERCAKCQYYQR